MSSIPATTRTLRGKYQVSRNIFVICYLDVLEATDQEIRAFLGLKNRSDTMLPVGTRIFLNADPINRINQRRNKGFDIYSIMVKTVENLNGKPLHTCTPISKETLNERRAQERKESEFPVQMKDGAEFIAMGGTSKGLTLYSTVKRAMLSMSLGQSYPFVMSYKGKDFTLTGEVKHIQYDWKNHRHMVGVQFVRLSQEEDAVLNLLLDPAYTIDLSERQTVDTALGKVSLED